MASTIKLKNGSGAPLASDLVAGEPALDLTNKRLYTEDSGGTVIEVGTNPTELQVDNINIDGNAITSTDTDGDITISPDGTGTVVIDTDLDVDNININGNTISSTDTNGNIAITPDGTGEVDISKVDIDGGTIDGTTIGGASAGAGTFTTLNASGDVAFDTDTLFVDASENAVGIGTTSPLRSLHVSGAGDTGLMLQTTNAVDDNEIWEIQVAGNASNFADLIFRSRANAGTGGSEAVRIDSSGNVGIGTTSPATNRKLTLQSDGTVTGGIRLNNNAGTEGANITLENPTTNTDLGIYSTGVTKMYTGGSERMRIDSAGNVGIGTSTPYSGNGVNFTALNLNGTKGGALAFSRGTNSATTQWQLRTTDDESLRFEYGSSYGTERMRIDSSGRLVFNPASIADNNNSIFSNSNGYMYVEGNTSGLILANNSGADCRIRVEDNNTIQFQTSSSEAMRIDSNGKVGIGQTVYAGGVHTGAYLALAGFSSTSTGNIPLECYTSSTATRYLASFSNPNAVVGSISTSGSATSYNTSSDYRLKENVVDMTGAVDRVKALNPSQFNFIADPDKTVDGFLPHEVSDVVPEAVTGTKDAMTTQEYEVTPAVLDDDGNVVTEAVMGTREVPDYQGIDQSKLVPLLTGALQEAIARIETLEAQVATLKGN